MKSATKTAKTSVAGMLGLVLIGGAMAAGCTRAQASVVVVPTPLEVPPPPPRQVEPVFAAAELPSEPLDAAIVTMPPEPPPRPAPRSTERPAEPAPSAAVASPAPASPSTTLQTLPAERERQVHRSVRASLDGAIANLNRVEYQRLGADARANFDQARRFIAQAEEALLARNLVFAETVAQKAATLAAQLAGL